LELVTAVMQQKKWFLSDQECNQHRQKQQHKTN
jgi:hypothetical protein